MNTLQLISRQHGGKVCDKWSLYLTEYDRIFGEFNERPVRLLEIGVQNGGSLEIWRKFFSNAERIIGCDIDPACARLLYDDPRIRLVVADANTDSAEQQISAFGPSLDIIIDDGSHRSEEIIATFSRYFKHLNYGGLYIVEDLHCSYWKEFSGGTIHAGGLFHPGAAVAFFKMLIDIVNHEHWGIDKARSELLLGFEQRYGVHFKEGSLRTIHSIEFVNSLCIIRKREADKNTLGARIVSGTTEAVAPGIRALNGHPSIAPDQRRNEWSTREESKCEEALRLELAELSQVLRHRDKRIVELEALVARCTAEAEQATQAQARLVSVQGDLRVVEAELKTASLELSQNKAALASAERASLAARRHLASLQEARQRERAEWDTRLEKIEEVRLRERKQWETRLANIEEARLRERGEWEAQLADAVRARQDADSARAGFEQELARKRDELAALLSSTLWQSTYPLRVVGTRLPSPVRRTLRRAARGVWRTAKRALPSERRNQPHLALDHAAGAAPISVAGNSVQRPQIVLVSGFPNTPSEEYRVLNPLSVLQQFYQTQAITAAEIDFHAETLKHASIILLFRVPWSPQLAGVVKEARAKGSLIVYDIDDYVFEPMIAKPSIIDGMRFLNESDLAAYHSGVQAYRRALLESDFCIVTTEFLAERVRELGKPVHVLPNSINPAMLRRYDLALKQRRQRRPDTKLRIGYAAGTLTHQRDFAVVRPVLAKLLRQRDDITLTVVGHLDLAEYPDLASLAQHIEVRPPVLHDDLPEELARFDINIAPLEIGNPFCEAKSELKFFNAALAEVPTVASATAPFQTAILDGQSGFLAANETQWLEVLTKLLDDPRLRARVGIMARNEALRQFGPGAMRAGVKQVFDELWRRRRPITPPRHAGYDHFLYAINYPTATTRYADVTNQTLARGNRADGPLNLQWIVPAFSVGWGGMTNIFRIIQQLEKYGHHNTLWVHNSPARMPNGATVSEYYRDMIARHFPPVDAEVYPLPSDLDQISGDAVIATDHFSAYPARAVANVKRRFYFLQDNEPAFSPAGYASLFAERTYRFGFDALSNGVWLHALAQRYGMWSMKWEQAADSDHYFTTGTEQRVPAHIAFYARQETPRRAVELGYLAFELLARDGAEFHVDLFGGERAPAALPYSFTHHGILSAAQLGELYRRASIGMVFSATNYSIIPREMMACGLPVLELNSESSRCSFPDGVAELADPTPESVAAHLKTLLLDRARREQLARQALKFLLDFSWERSAREIERALLMRLGRTTPELSDQELVKMAGQ